MRALKQQSRYLPSILIAAILMIVVPVSSARAAGFVPTACGACNVCAGPFVQACDTGCAQISRNLTTQTNTFLDNSFVTHQRWMTQVLFAQNILPAMMLMTEQLTAAAMHQVLVIGTFLDAKHQLETQRLFQELMAQAHKDYHPSEGMCTFGTATRSLAAADRNAELSAIAISGRILQRELLSGDAVASGGRSSDYLSRMKQFREVYCSRGDNGIGLSSLCPNMPADLGRINNDISYTNLMEAPLTLRLNFTPGGNADHTARGISPDEEDILALAANLYAHQVAPTIPSTYLSDAAGVPNIAGATQYLNIRSIAAKRSVARNSFAAIAALKTQGEAEVQPYLYAIIREMGVGQTDATDITTYLGARPSYYAQMEVLTKKLYQNPSFYTDLIDKPANVDRKTVAMQAIELMQRRDIYRSILRSESVLSVMLETALMEQQEPITNEINRMNSEGETVELPNTP